MKKLKGYTLIELIIVIAIIGILSATLMPNMIGLAGKSKFRTAQSQAKSIFNSAQTIAQKYEAIDRAIVKAKEKRFSGVLTFGNLDGVTNFKDANKDGSKEAHDFYDKLKAMNTHLNDCKWVVVIENYKVTHVLWSDSSTDNYVGVYCGNTGCSMYSDHNADFKDYRKDHMENIGEKWVDINTALAAP